MKKQDKMKPGMVKKWKEGTGSGKAMTPQMKRMSTIAKKSGF